MTNLVVTISGEFADLDDGDLEDLREDLDDTLRLDWGGSAILVTVSRC